MKAVILAAGLGTRLAPLTDDRPKCMVPVAGRPIIDRMIERLGQAGVTDIIVVTGYRADALEKHLRGSADPLARAVRLVANPHYHDWGNFYSVLVAEAAVGADSFLKLDGDVLIPTTVLPRLLAAPGPGVLALDRKPCGAEEMKIQLDDKGRVVDLSKQVDPARAAGESIGIERIDAALAPRFFRALEELIAAGQTHEYYEAAYAALVKQGFEFHVAEVTGLPWTEIDDKEDLAYAEELAQQQD